jgi:hypothetical protein
MHTELATPGIDQSVERWRYRYSAADAQEESLRLASVEGVFRGLRCSQQNATLPVSPASCWAAASSAACLVMRATCILPELTRLARSRTPHQPAKIATSQTGAGGERLAPLRGGTGWECSKADPF